MMTALSAILQPERVCADFKASTLKEVFTRLSQLLAPRLPSLSADALLEAFIARERLGSTVMGHGIALPHVRSPQANTALGALLKLQHKVDFQDANKAMVDIVFGLVVPEHQPDEHLNLLATLSKKFSDPKLREAVRHTQQNQHLYHLMVY